MTSMALCSLSPIVLGSMEPMTLNSMTPTTQGNNEALSQLINTAVKYVRILKDPQSILMVEGRSHDRLPGFPSTLVRIKFKDM